MTQKNDPKRFYRIEAREILDGLSSELLLISRGEVRPDAPAQLFRLAHTLKGAATVVGDATVAELARILEDVLGAHRDSGDPLTVQEATEFLRMVSGLESALTTDQGKEPQHQGLLPEESATAAASHESLSTVRIELEDLDGVTTSLATAESQTTALVATVRELDALIAQLAQLVEDDVVQPVGELRGSGKYHGGMARHRDSVREAVNRLERARRTALTRADSALNELQRARERLGHLSLIQAVTAFPGVERATQLAAAAVGKTVRFESSGGDVRLDRHVLPVVSNALLHLVRNSVDHGIETPKVRAARLKAAQGTVKIRVERRGSRVAFVCEDDGAGIDPVEVRRLAVQRGLLSQAEVDQLDDAAALKLLFRAGVSTRSAVTELSGRGVGLDVVGTAASTLHGSATITSQLGFGTRVELVVPVSLSTATVVALKVEETSLLLPLDVVKSVLRVPTSAVSTSTEGEVILFEGELVPVLRLGPALGYGSARVTSGVPLAVAIVQIGDDCYGLVADAASAISEVIVRPLPWAAGAPLGVAGAALDVEGISRLVLDPRGLLSILQKHAGRAPEPLAPAAVRRYLPILVVDDSLTTRMLEQSILQTAGFEVDVATSAEEGLAMAAARDYGLFVVDVEMPGMNGFEFTKTTRADARFKDTRVILVTSLSSEADQRRGRDAGASAYVVKGQFDQESLLVAGSIAFSGAVMKPIRILVVEDSRTVLERLLEVLSGDPGFEVVGHASDGRTAMELCERLRPDVMSLNMVLSGQNGLDVTRHVMANCATPILIVSSSANRGEAFDTLEALQAGAVEVFDKSRMACNANWVAELKSALRLVARIRVVTRVWSRDVHDSAPASGISSRANAIPNSVKSMERPREASSPDLTEQSGAYGTRSLVVLGASTGGPAAVAQVLSELPIDFRLPIVLVMHMTPLFASALAEWLGRHTRRSVRLAADREPLPHPGRIAPILVAPPEHHLVLEGGRLRLMHGPERHSCRPSNRRFLRVRGGGVRSEDDRWPIDRDGARWCPWTFGAASGQGNYLCPRRGDERRFRNALRSVSNRRGRVRSSVASDCGTAG
ncbi:MAG: response regulator [Polyangiaceae bacterium]